ncbi:bromodomain-containing protein 4-like isoform X2 [Cylas formicarius]|nr:bromodomain-containing protein 4-like isoform X2 [Cylas formicarius]XP_060519930.1 bromodomain-containing protein 4-like isoform X2 [Cylas formicarius]XP_060519935.1 bromodomain-containing protein 4-like isoform X2 [Cylas formicarius]
MKSASVVATTSPFLTDVASNDILQCLECDLVFTSEHYLHNHLYHHIKQPVVRLQRVQTSQNPPLKITLKNRSGNSFEIVSSPSSSVTSDSGFKSFSNLEDREVEDQYLPGDVEGLGDPDENEYSAHEPDEGENYNTDHDQNEDQEPNDPFEGIDDALLDRALESADAEEDEANEGEEERANVSFSPNFTDVGGDFLEGDSDAESPVAPGTHSPLEGQPSPKETGHSTEEKSETGSTTAGVDAIGPGENATQDYNNIPGAEPTPPPEPSPEYPKIKIKTTGLFKDPEPQRCTITEITDDNPSGDPSVGNSNTPMWTTPSLEDPLKLPDSDDHNLLSLFSNNDRAKDLGFSTSENEFISLDRFDERNRGAMQLYNPNNAVSTSSTSSLDSLTGLPMQALAQQVSRLQPNNNNGLHQQNVLINIQQFPSGPPQPSYQPPPMYPPHYPPHPGQPPMHQPYQPYQPPNPMYYPPAPGYPSQHMVPPPPQMGQLQPPPPHVGQQPPMSQPPNQMVPSSQNQQVNQMQQAPQPYRQPMPPRANPPRGPQGPGQRMPMNGPRGPPRPQPLQRQRAPMIRPRGPGVAQVRGAMRPRMAGPSNNQNGVRPGQQTSPLKRTPEQMQTLQAKKKRLDILTPSDKDDDDCQVICMQPKNTDGGLPQIESVQGATTESSIMHLSDSITLSVRNPPPKPAASPQKSDAKAVANILATRGITVTATAKPKEKESPQKAPSLPTALSLNGAVSIVAAPKANTSPKPATDNLPTVDLTDDTTPAKQAGSPQKISRPGLPYRCDLCPAQYPNSTGLSKHRQTYHKTTGGMCELGIPLINLKQPGMIQKLSQMGIHNYIPLPSSGSGSFALPIISTRNPGNIEALGSTQMLSLGPVRTIPKPNTSNLPVAKQLNQK